MQLVVIDSLPDKRSALVGRVQEALRQADIHRLEVADLSPGEVHTFEWAQACGCIVGPGCYEDFPEIVDGIRLSFSSGKIAVVLDDNLYASEAVQLRRRLNVQILALGDLVQIASFVMDCEAGVSEMAGGSANRGIIGVTQLKGGVGTTSVAAGLAACWARHGLAVAALDFDDVNPQLTAWARVGVAQRTVTSELLRLGEVPAHRINEMVHPVESFDGKLVVVGQPEAYNESFHFKANVLEGVVSASEFVQSLIEVLALEFDAIVIDLGKSWGVSTFAALPLCQHVLLVTDDDGMSVRRTLDGFERLKMESDDPDEFNVDNWSLLLNSFTGRLISPKEIAVEIQEMELFSPDSNLFTIPYTEGGRQWGAPGETMYDTTDEKTKQIIRKIAYNLIPFRYEVLPSLGSKLAGKLSGLIGGK